MKRVHGQKTKCINFYHATLQINKDNIPNITGPFLYNKNLR